MCLDDLIKEMIKNGKEKGDPAQCSASRANARMVEQTIVAV